MSASGEGQVPTLCIIAAPRCPGTPAARLSLPPRSPLPINSTGRARREADVARRAEGKEAALPEQVGGGHRCGRGAAAGPLRARLPMGVIESSQGPTVRDCPHRQRFCFGLGELRGRGRSRVGIELPGTAGLRGQEPF